MAFEKLLKVHFFLEKFIKKYTDVGQKNGICKGHKKYFVLKMDFENFLINWYILVGKWCLKYS